MQQAVQQQYVSNIRCAQRTNRVSPSHAQAAGGHGPERKQRIDWMYEGPMQSTQDQQAEANEYLMGKEVRRARSRVRSSSPVFFNQFSPIICAVIFCADCRIVVCGDHFCNSSTSRSSSSSSSSSSRAAVAFPVAACAVAAVALAAASSRMTLIALLSLLPFFISYTLPSPIPTGCFFL